MYRRKVVTVRPFSPSTLPMQWGLRFLWRGAKFGCHLGTFFSTCSFHCPTRCAKSSLVGPARTGVPDLCSVYGPLKGTKEPGQARKRIASPHLGYLAVPQRESQAKGVRQFFPVHLLPQISSRRIATVHYCSCRLPKHPPPIPSSTTLNSKETLLSLTHPFSSYSNSPFLETSWKRLAPDFVVSTPVCQVFEAAD